MYHESARGDFGKKHFPPLFKQGIFFQKISREAIVSTEHILRKTELALSLHFLDKETASHRVLMTCPTYSWSMSGSGNHISKARRGLQEFSWESLLLQKNFTIDFLILKSKIPCYLIDKFLLALPNTPHTHTLSPTTQKKTSAGPPTRGCEMFGNNFWYQLWQTEIIIWKQRVLQGWILYGKTLIHWLISHTARQTLQQAWVLEHG